MEKNQLQEQVKLLNEQLNSEIKSTECKYQMKIT